MPDNYDIGFDVKDLNAFTKAMKEAAGATQDAADAQEKLNKSISKTNKASSSGGKIRFASGPHQRLTDLENQLGVAQNARNADAVADLRYLIERQRKLVERIHKKPATFQDKLKSAIFSTRVGVGRGGLQVAPLLGRTAQALAAGTAAEPHMAAVLFLSTAAAAAAAGLFKLTDSAAQSARVFSALGFTGGGTRRETAALMGLGGSIGMSPERVGSLAASFNERITSDPYARAFASQMGINNVAGPYGNQDWTKELLDAIKGLRKIADPNERLRAARAVGLEEALPFTLLSERQYRMVGPGSADERLRSNVFDSKLQQQSADFQSAQSRLSQSLDTFSAAFSGQFVNSFTEGLNSFADAMNAFSQMGQKPLLPQIADMLGLGGILGTDKVEQKTQAQALAENTQAVDENTQAINKGRHVYGRGERANSAIPDALSGDNLRRSLAAGGLALNPF